MMRRIIIGLLCWLLSAQLAFAAVTLSSTASATTSTMTSPMTFATQAIGTAAADRIIFVILGMSVGVGTVTDISSVTIGGITATQVNKQGFGSLADGLGIYQAIVPTGTTASIVITSTGGDFGFLGGAGISVYRTVGADTTTPVSSSPTDTDNTLSGTVLSGGVAIVGYVCDSTGATPGVGWSGVTEDVDLAWSSNNAVFSTANASTSYTATTTPVGGCAGQALINGASIQQAAGGATVNSQLMTLGVGQ